MLASLVPTTAAVKNMAVEGRAPEIHLDQVEAQSSHTNVQLDAVVKMSRAKERISPRSWAPHKCLIMSFDKTCRRDIFLWLVQVHDAVINEDEG